MKAWRESASLIIAARNGLNHSQTYDYSLLFLKRHIRANFGGALVYPGGMIESADADLKWQNLYRDHGYDDKSFKFLLPNSKNRPEIFRSKENELAREISLRISAIRETFEECGILLCKNSSGSTTNSEKADYFPISNDELSFWQDKVHSDANEFYNMCEKLQCYPNLWALHEWANWMTPTFFPNRFNTAFFFTCLSQIPNSKPDYGEIDEVLWTSPEDAKKLDSYLLPPQQYELSTIARYKCIDDLIEFALEKSRNGATLFLPVRVILRDGAVHLLPGDSIYPEKVDLYEKQFLDKSFMTIKEFREISPKINRTELFDNPENKDSVSSKL